MLPSSPIQKDPGGLPSSKNKAGSAKYPAFLLPYTTAPAPSKTQLTPHLI
jgi:hypothetical protein